MTADSATYISQLNTALPSDDDTKCAADFTVIKTAIKNTFPNITGEVVCTHNRLNTAHSGGSISGTLLAKGSISIQGRLSADEINFTQDTASLSVTGQMAFDKSSGALKLNVGKTRDINSTLLNVHVRLESNKTISTSTVNMGLHQSLSFTWSGENWFNSSNGNIVVPDPGLYKVCARYEQYYGSPYVSSSLTLRLKKGSTVVGVEKVGIGPISYTKYVSADFFIDVTATKTLSGRISRATGYTTARVDQCELVVIKL